MRPGTRPSFCPDEFELGRNFQAESEGVRTSEALLQARALHQRMIDAADIELEPRRIDDVRRA